MGTLRPMPVPGGEKRGPRPELEEPTAKPERTADEEMAYLRELHDKHKATMAEMDEVLKRIDKSRSENPVLDRSVPLPGRQFPKQ